jgi:hypothetical protein
LKKTPEDGKTYHVFVLVELIFKEMPIKIPMLFFAETKKSYGRIKDPEYQKQS